MKENPWSAIIALIIILSSLLIGIPQINASSSQVHYINHLPYTIDNRGKYILNVDEHGLDAAITIKSNNVVLNGDGHVLEGGNTGVEVYGRGITIKNFKIINNTFGIFLSDSSNNLIYNNAVNNARSDISVELHGSSNNNVVYVNDFNNIHNIRSDSSSSRINPAVYNYSVILVEFSDVKHSIDLQNIYKALQDLSKYIEESSYGLYKFNYFLSEKWYVLPRSINYYAHHLNELLLDSIKASDPDINFSKWQRVIIVHAGKDAAFTNKENDIRSQYFLVGCGAPAKTNDNFLISSAIIVSEYSTLGIYAHEFLHSLGAIDLYGPPGKREKPVGVWDIMATGWRSGVEVKGKYLIMGLKPTHPSSWTKMRIGLFREGDLVIVGPGHHEIEILPLEDESSGIHAIKIPISSYKYYLIEVREKKGFDLYLPTEGFLVYIANETATDIRNGILQVIDAKPSTLTLNDAPFKPGQVLYDKNRNLIIRFLREYNKYKVIIDYKSTNLAVIPSSPKIGYNNTIISAVLKNTGHMPIKKVIIYVFIDGVLRFKKRINELSPGIEYPFSFKTPNIPGNHTVLLDAQVLDDIIEYNYNDNKVILTYTYKVKGKKITESKRWPQAVAPGVYAPFELHSEDLDGDRKDEFVITMEMSSDIYLVDNNGFLIKELPLTYLFTDDLDGDNIKEIIGVNGSGVYVISLEPNGLSKVIQNTIGIKRTYDIDVKTCDVNNDGMKDLIMVYPRNQRLIRSKVGGLLHYYDTINLVVCDGLTGEILYNFTVTNNPEETFEYSYYKYLGIQIGLINVNDINNDGKPEILVGFLKNEFEEVRWYNEKAYVLYCYSLDGKLLWRREVMKNPLWRREQYVYFYNIDNKVKVILITTMNKLYLLNCDGNVLWALEVWNPKVIGNFGKEIIFSGGNYIKLVNILSGAIIKTIELPSYPLETALISKSNGIIVLFTTKKGFYIYNENGVILNNIKFNTYCWFTLLNNTKAVIYLYNNNSIYIADLSSYNISKLFDSKISGKVIPVNLDNDQEFEYLVFGSYLQAYESNGSVIWSYGLGGRLDFYHSKVADLDNDGIPDAVFLKGDFERSIIIFKSGKLIYDINNVAFADLNKDGFSEVIAVSDRGLEVYDLVGNLVWNVRGADFRAVSIGDFSNKEKIIAVSVGIFARYLNIPPQVRIYSENGKLLKVIGFYWDPPSVHVVKSKALNRSLIIIVGPWSRGEYHLEVYNEMGVLIFNRIVDERAWKSETALLDVNNDGIEEIIIPPYVFTLDGKLLKNNYQALKKKVCIDVNDDKINEYIDVVCNKDKFVLILRDNNGSIISKTKVNGRGIYAFKSGYREIVIYALSLTKHGYYIVPIKCYYLRVISNYGKPRGEGLYIAGSKANFSISPVLIDYGNNIRRIFVGWTGDLNISSAEGTIVMNSPKTVIAIWKKPHNLWN